METTGLLRLEHMLHLGHMLRPGNIRGWLTGFNANRPAPPPHQTPAASPERGFFIANVNWGQYLVNRRCGLLISWKYCPQLTEA